MKFKQLAEIVNSVHVANLYLEDAMNKGGDERADNLHKAKTIIEMLEEELNELEA